MGHRGIQWGTVKAILWKCASKSHIGVLCVGVMCVGSKHGLGSECTSTGLNFTLIAGNVQLIELATYWVYLTGVRASSGGICCLNWAFVSLVPEGD